MLLGHTLRGGDDPYNPGGYSDEFWDVVRQKLLFSVGRPRLSARAATELDDTFIYLETCSDAEFLDFIELALGTDTPMYLHVNLGGHNALVSNINAAFDAGNLPYQLTDYVWEEVRDGYGTGHRIGHFPQIILREDQVTHSQAIEPVLHLLAQPGLASADQEFLDALQHYRKAEYGDCLTKCGSALESTIKLICGRRKWPHKETDTLATLLQVYFDHSGLPGFFKEPIMLVGTIRNRLSTSHGAGAVPKSVSPQIAHYAVNSTAAAILLLVAEEWQ
jgi:hypothetical protein